MPSWVGDVVMASCVWNMTRKKYPNAKIVAAIRPHLAPLLEGVEAFDEVVPVDMKTSVFNSAKQCKAIQADAIILLPNSFRAALIARLAGIPIRAGYRRDRRSWLLTDAVEIKVQETPSSTIEYYGHLANELFAMREESTLPSLPHHDSKLLLFEDADTPIVLLVAGASKAQKRWSPINFAKVADALHKEGATCFAIGSPEEHSLVQEVINHASSPIKDLTQVGITLGNLPEVVQHSDLMITNDTGPRHIAVACGTPTITLYGPTDFRWTKYDCELDISLLADPFLPTHLVADRHPERCDIDSIPPSDVIAHAKRIINS
jgi:heptosyltransferase-2